MFVLLGASSAQVQKEQQRVYHSTSQCKIVCIVERYAVYFVSSDAGWSSLAARRAHNPKVTGSNPVPATSFEKTVQMKIWAFFLIKITLSQVGCTVPLVKLW